MHLPWQSSHVLYGRQAHAPWRSRLADLCQSFLLGQRACQQMPPSPLAPPQQASPGGDFRTCHQQTLVLFCCASLLFWPIHLIFLRYSIPAVNRVRCTHQVCSLTNGHIHRSSCHQGSVKEGVFSAPPPTLMERADCVAFPGASAPLPPGLVLSWSGHHVDPSLGETFWFAPLRSTPPHPTDPWPEPARGLLLPHLGTIAPHFRAMGDEELSTVIRLPVPWTGHCLTSNPQPPTRFPTLHLCAQNLLPGHGLNRWPLVSHLDK